MIYAAVFPAKHQVLASGVMLIVTNQKRKVSPIDCSAALSQVLVEKGKLAMERCFFCQGALTPGTQPCPHCGRLQPSGSPGAASGALTRPCPTCGEALPLDARFCANCGRSLSAEIDLAPLAPGISAPEHLPGVSNVPVAPAGPQSGGVSVPGAPAGPQSGVPGIPSTSAAPQSGLSTVPGASAGPQGGAAGVPSAPSWPQSGAPGVPGAPAGPQSGAPGVPSTPASPPASAPPVQAVPVQGAGRGLAHLLRGKLLGTGAGKVLLAVLAVVVVAGGTTAVLAASGVKLPFGGAGGSGAAPSAGAHPTSSASTATTTGPNGAPPNTASFKISFTVSDPSVHFPGNPEHLLLVMGGTVCGPHDNGQPFTYPDPKTPGDTDTSTTTCSGSYHGGKLSYTQMVVRFAVTVSTGVTCTITAQSPWMYQFEGTFTSPTSSSGTITGGNGAEPETCSGGFTNTLPPANGTLSWTGTVSTTA